MILDNRQTYKDYQLDAVQKTLQCQRTFNLPYLMSTVCVNKYSKYAEKANGIHQITLLIILITIFWQLLNIVSSVMYVTCRYNGFPLPMCIYINFFCICGQLKHITKYTSMYEICDISIFLNILP